MEFREERLVVANACRVLAVRGLVDDILGHVSVMADEETVLVRCRGNDERGLRFTTVDDIRAIPLHGPVSPGDDYQLPAELPLHLELLRTLPDVRSVVHAHPPAVVAFSLTGFALQPIVGAFNIPAMRMALDGVPMYSSSALIRSEGRAKEMARALGNRPVCVLRGHGLVATGATVPQAVIRALNIETLARMHLELLRVGTSATPIGHDDLVDLPDLGDAFNEGHVWRFLMRELEELDLLLS